MDKTLSSKTPNKIHKCAKMTKNISTIQMDDCPDRRICAFMCHLLFNLDIKSNKKKKKEITFTELPLHGWQCTVHFWTWSHLFPQKKTCLLFAHRILEVQKSEATWKSYTKQSHTRAEFEHKSCWASRSIGGFTHREIIFNPRISTMVSETEEGKAFSSVCSKTWMGKQSL